MGGHSILLCTPLACNLLKTRHYIHCGSIIVRDSRNFHRLWEVKVLCEFIGPVGLDSYTVNLINQ